MSGASGFHGSCDSEASNQGRNYNEDRQDKHGDQPEHIGSIDIPGSGSEVLAEGSVLGQVDHEAGNRI